MTLATTGTRGGCRSSRARVRRSGSLAGATISVWNAWLTGSGVTRIPAATSASLASRTASVAPPTTACSLLLMLAMTTYPRIRPTMAWISPSAPITATMAPLSGVEMLLISLPRALTASMAAGKLSAPAAISAPYSPRLWPITMSGSTPYAASMRTRPASTASRAGWVTAVWRSSRSACRAWASSRGWTKMWLDRVRPRSGVITLSASAMAPAMSASPWHSAPNMLTY